MGYNTWMYQDSSQWLWRMNYCNGVQGFISFATSIPRNFTRGGIRHFVESCKIIYWKCITDVDTDINSPSAFIGGPKLPTESPTDDANSKGWALMHLCPCALADGIIDGRWKIWRVIKKFWCEIQNLPTEFWNITDNLIKINII
jgi:hypothetical protein